MRALVVGWGKMGQLRSVALSQLGIRWEVVDPVQPSQYYMLEAVPLEDYSHVVIATPPDQHSLVYDQLVDAGFDGQILIEKPVTTTEYDIRRILGDSRVTAGMTERCQPGTADFLSQIQQTDKVRILWDGDISDGMIHPIDLIVWGLRSSNPVEECVILDRWGNRIRFTLGKVNVEMDMLPTIKQRKILLPTQEYDFSPKSDIVWKHTWAWLYQQAWIHDSVLEGHLLWKHLETTVGRW